MKRNSLIVTILILAATQNISADTMLLPYIKGDFWQVTGNPDLEKYNSEKQQPVDFACWQAADGTWQIWSCIRFTSLGGHTRLFHRWEGKNITDTDWEPMGIAMISKPELGEPLGGLQAPHVVKHNGAYWMMYGDWDVMRMAISTDGKNFTRFPNEEKPRVLFTNGISINTRDPMMIFTKGKWHCYYTAFPNGHGYNFVRTSTDLLNWSNYSIVAYGGRAGNNPYAAECPQVIEPVSGRYFLFRTQMYGANSKTSIYYSKNPMDFGIDNDSKFVREMKISAPEIVKSNGKYYLVSLNLGLDGIRIAELRFKELNESVINLNNKSYHNEWKIKSSNSGIEDSIFDISKNQPAYEAPMDYYINTSQIGNRFADNTWTGIIESPTFTLDQNDYSVYIAGGTVKEDCHVAIIDTETNTELARYSGYFDSKFRPAYFDASKYIGKKVSIRLVDNSDQFWGNIAFGGIYTNQSLVKELN